MDNPTTVKLPEVDFVRLLQQPKDIRLSTREDGSFASTCKTCDVNMKSAEKSGLMWYVCPQCKRAAFQPVANVKRDVALAAKYGGTFESELFYLAQLPSGFEPPPECLA